jgi:hypothetical protein
MAGATIAGVGFLEYDPWRMKRVESAMQLGSRWPDAVRDGEMAAVPSSERYVAYCMAGDGPAAEFARTTRGQYQIVQNGRVAIAAGQPHRVSTSLERFRSRSEWASSVSEVSKALRCQSLTIVFPPSCIMWADLDSRGKVVRKLASGGWLP